MQKSWGTLITEARNEIWPFPGESKPQKPSHDKFFKLAAMDLQHWIPELRVNNASLYKFCTTFFQCGLTVITDAPVGLVRRVYTIANDDWCDRVDYVGAEYCEVQCWSRNLLQYTVPTFDGMRTLPMGYRDADASSDSASGRARMGIWARHNHRLYIAPWIQSNETVVVEWDGVKKEWLDSDVLNTDLWDERVMEAIKLFVKWKHEHYFGGDAQKTMMLEREYANERADLIHYFAEITKSRGDKVCCEPRLPTQAELEDDANPSEPAPLILAAVGDYGVTTGASITPTGVDPAATTAVQYRDQIAALVDSWKPDRFIGLGDLWYGNTNTLENLIASQPAEYQQYVQDGKFLPVIGNHDRDPAGRLDILRSYFTFPKITTASGPIDSPGYYSVALDSRIEVFVIDTGYDNSQVNQQEDGVDVNSNQAAWLRVALARSTAKFKIVCGHHTPYTSFPTEAEADTLSNDGYLNYPQLRWPLAEWGAHAYLCGHVHNLEHLEVNGFPYLIVGAGGRNIANDNEAALSTYSKYHYEGFGALRMTVGCDSLDFEFFDRTGTLLHSFTINT